VVATAVGGLREIICDGETGVLVPPGDGGALVAAVAELLAHPEHRARLGAAARARLAAHFSLAAQIDALMAIYDRLRAERVA